MRESFKKFFNDSDSVETNKKVTKEKRKGSEVLKVKKSKKHVKSMSLKQTKSSTRFTRSVQEEMNAKRAQQVERKILHKVRKILNYLYGVKEDFQKNLGKEQR